jgi:hypothetical protein
LLGTIQQSLEVWDAGMGLTYIENESPQIRASSPVSIDHSIEYFFALFVVDSTPRPVFFSKSRRISNARPGSGCLAHSRRHSLLQIGNTVSPWSLVFCLPHSPRRTTFGHRQSRQILQGLLYGAGPLSRDSGGMRSARLFRPEGCLDSDAKRRVASWCDKLAGVW